MLCVGCSYGTETSDNSSSCFFCIIPLSVGYKTTAMFSSNSLGLNFGTAKTGLGKVGPSSTCFPLWVKSE